MPSVPPPHFQILSLGINHSALAALNNANYIILHSDDGLREVAKASREMGLIDVDHGGVSGRALF
jgi:hypothetical protein